MTSDQLCDRLGTILERGAANLGLRPTLNAAVDLVVDTAFVRTGESNAAALVEDLTMRMKRRAMADA